MDIKARGYCGPRVHLAQDRVQLSGLMNKVMKFMDSREFIDLLSKELLLMNHCDTLHLHVWLCGPSLPCKLGSSPFLRLGHVLARLPHHHG